MGRMSQVQWGSAKNKQIQLVNDEREVEDDMVDTHFNHSWTPIGPMVGSGWYWIPKGVCIWKLPIWPSKMR